jgi:hypothetical protein
LFYVYVKNISHVKIIVKHVSMCIIKTCSNHNYRAKRNPVCPTLEEKLKLDPIDQRIIEAVKRNGRLARQVLGEATGLSATPETSVMTSTPRHKSAVWLQDQMLRGLKGNRGFKSHPLPALDR